MMSKSTRRPQAPTVRNFAATTVRDLDVPYRPKAIKNKIKKKIKHTKIVWDD
jgi:hypothetical protein